MNATYRSAALLTACLGGILLMAAQTARSEAAGPDEEPDALLERGRYLVTISGCNDCHTPLHMGPNGPEPDWSRMLSGHPESLVMPPRPALPSGPWQIIAAETSTAWSGPWGVSFTANLTPDQETGLGEWTLKEFVDTIRTGRHLGRGRPILPPMPILMYKHMTDADLAAVYTYLRSIPAIRNKVPDPIVPDEPPLEEAIAPGS